jgi:hypothetical protein
MFNKFFRVMWNILCVGLFLKGFMDARSNDETIMIQGIIIIILSIAMFVTGKYRDKKIMEG